MNRLAGSISPYLRLHAGNPVDWWPWGDGAFADAAATDRPVLVSVGYASCHWCHVMAHESFENASVAALMNELFVNVKVDREERPDVDAVYMDALVAQQGHGGWPMTVFCMPDGRPFFTGTYFPPAARNGSPGFVDVLRAVGDLWRNRRAEVTALAGELTSALAARAGPALGTGPDRRRGAAQPGAAQPGAARLALQGTEPAATLRALGYPEDLDARAFADLARLADPHIGGFGHAPKFPQAPMVELALRLHVRAAAATEGTAQAKAPHAGALDIARRALDSMAAGGIHDHLAGGFARYSVDATWTVPHFEKMLYDQAQLARCYLHGWQATGDPAYRHVLGTTIAYVLGRLSHPGGGLFSAQDADCGGIEGATYLWKPNEIASACDDTDLAELACRWWSVTPEGNFEGATVLRRPLGTTVWPEAGGIGDARRLLLSARDARVQPLTDTKVLAEWNAMLLTALAEAAWATGEADWKVAASRLAEFLWGNLRDRRGRWRRAWHDGALSEVPAFAADHAWLVEAALAMSTLTGDGVWADRAVGVAEELVSRFWDEDSGVLATSANDAPPLVVRTFDLFDGALPSANAVAAVAFCRLADLTGNVTWREHAESIVSSVSAAAAGRPAAFSHMIWAVDLLARGVTQVVLPGAVMSATPGYRTGKLLAELRRWWLPGANVVTGTAATYRMGAGADLFEARTEGTAYACRAGACDAPARTPGELTERLSHHGGIRLPAAPDATAARP